MNMVGTFSTIGNEMFAQKLITRKGIRNGEKERKKKQKKRMSIKCSLVNVSHTKSIYIPSSFQTYEIS